MKWDTISASLWHSGQSSVRVLLARDVANIFKSVLSLVYRRRMSGFRISFIYSGTTYSFDRICLVANRVDDAIEFLQTWMNWSFRRFLKNLCDWPQVTDGSYQISPSPFDVNKNFILCIYWWFSLTLNWKHLFNSTLLVPLNNRIQYLTHKANALCDIGNLANSPYKHVLLEYLLTFKAFFMNEVCTRS